MARAIKHRGPDSEGAYVSPNRKVAFGFSRLAIIDLSPSGNQPMNYLGRYWIVCNGEIYNYQKLKQKLILAGYKFRSQSDIEVIMALYHKFGVNCVKYLRGMFAFAIFDEMKNTLFCARDRVGKKPFKYYLDNKVFMFASELKAILTQKEYRRQPDYLAIHHYLTLQYAPSPLTGFVGIKKLEPGHFMFLDVSTGKMIKKRYWKLDYSKKLNLSEEEWKQKIMEKLEESVRLRMISDVPLGAFLSGGIDSSAVVGLMSRNSSTPIKTFTIAFGEPRYDESKYAKVVANVFRTDHTVFTVKPETIEILPMLVRQYEEPYADSSGLATYCLSKLTRDWVTVALNGDGGDENFGGYGRYAVGKFAFSYEKLGVLHRLMIAPLVRLLAMGVKNTFTNRALRFSNSVLEDYRRRYVDYIYYFDNQMKADGYTDNFAKKYQSIDTYELVMDKFNEAKVGDVMDQMFYSDFVSYLPDDLLVKVDMATMMVSLEGRSPFLDHEFLELTAKVCHNLKIKGFNDKKYLLKKALSGFVPDEVMYRPKKGFGVPLEYWFREDLKKYISHILLSKKFNERGILKKEFVSDLLRRHFETNVNYSPQIWSLLTLELWFREYFD